MQKSGKRKKQRVAGSSRFVIVFLLVFISAGADAASLTRFESAALSEFLRAPVSDPASASVHCLSAPSGQVPTRQTGWVTGTVFDPALAVIPGAMVTIDSARTKRTVVTDQLGKYAFEVPEDVYQITCNVPSYYPFRRANVWVRSGTSKTINLAPVLQILAIGIEVTPLGAREPVLRGYTPKYETLSVPKSANPYLQLVVRFANRKQNGSSVNYQNTMVSYDSLTIYADRTRLNKRSLELVFNGRVIVEDGKEQMLTQRATLSFIRGEPKVRLVK